MKKKLSLQDFSEILAQRENIDRKAADAFARSFFDIIEQGLQTDKFVKIKGFGTFKLVAVSERESVNINTGERFQISGHTKVSFTPDTTMKELVNRPFAHFEAVDLNDDTDTKEFEVIDEEMEEETDEEPEEADLAPTTDDIETTEVEEIDSNNDTDSTNEDSTERSNHEAIAAANDNDRVSNEMPIEIITDQTPTPPQEEQAPSATPNNEPSTEPNVTPTTSVTDGNNANNGQPTEQAEAPNTAAVPNKRRDKEDIVVTDPTPISSSQAASATTTPTGTTESDKTTATVGYTYNEVPSPHKHNWWKTLSMLLLVFALMVASYFVGYYRMLCPTCDNYIFGSTATTQPAPATPTKVSQPAPVVRPTAPATIADSNMAHTTDSAQKANQKANRPNSETKPSNVASSASASAKAQTNNQSTTSTTPQRPKTHCVGKGENIYRIARKYYGDDSYAEKIIKANNLKDANTIVVGMELKLP